MIVVEPRALLGGEQLGQHQRRVDRTQGQRLERQPWFVRLRKLEVFDDQHEVFDRDAELALLVVARLVGKDMLPGSSAWEPPTRSPASLSKHTVEKCE